MDVDSSGGSTCIDFEFEMAAENIDSAKIKLMLKRNPMPSQKSIDASFVIACALRNVPMLKAVRFAYMKNNLNLIMQLIPYFGAVTSYLACPDEFES